MIVVSGTKRSGTSMWMQLLQAVGFPAIGSAFSRNWETTIKDANPGGFYESPLRGGIYYATNPHPKTGAYLFPEATRRHVVKVFIPGLVRSDRAYLDRVIATVRPWRQYVTSINRLTSMEAAASAEKRAENGIDYPTPMDPALEWWDENFTFVRDVVTRKYPFVVVAYESVVERPEETLTPVFEWLDNELDPAPAIAAVRADYRTQTDESDVGDCGIDADACAVFDRYYEAVKLTREISQELVDEMNFLNERLEPRIIAERNRVRLAARERALKIRAARAAASVEAPAAATASLDG